MADGRIVIVGSSMVDLVAYAEHFPADGETLVGQSFLQGFGGKGANQAVMAAQLGADVVFIGRVGDDALGESITANLARHGVDVAGVTVTAGTASGVAPIWVDARGVNRILVIPGANGRLTPTDVEGALARVATAGVVIGQLETPQDATAAAFTWARTVGAITILNPAPAAPLEDALLAATDWLVPNEIEFAALAGGVPTPETVADAGRRWGCRVLVTMGAAGAMVADGARVDVVAAPVVVPVDTTGAGDAFLGGFAYGLSRDLTPIAAAQLGCACGGLSVTKPGAQGSFPDREAVERVLRAG